MYLIIKLFTFAPGAIIYQRFCRRDTGRQAGKAIRNALQKVNPGQLIIILVESLSAYPGLSPVGGRVCVRSAYYHRFQNVCSWPTLQANEAVSYMDRRIKIGRVDFPLDMFETNNSAGEAVPNMSQKVTSISVYPDLPCDVHSLFISFHHTICHLIKCGLSFTFASNLVLKASDSAVYPDLPCDVHSILQAGKAVRNRMHHKKLAN
ncbi:hypothetical protein V8E54_000340 [Elaphomyces granulatus]